MDVSLSGRRVWALLLGLSSLSFISCGDRYNLATAAGQQARIDDANFHLSKGECSAAEEAIDPLYNSAYVTDQVRIIKAATQACNASFNLLTFAANIAGSSNYFKSLALSLSNTAGDSARSWMYKAVDVLTQSGGHMSAYQRTASENTYMIFLQLGVVSSIIRNYGSPDGSGNQGAALGYLPGSMSNEDACALAASFSFITDSFPGSDLSDNDTKTLTSSLNSMCTAAGLASCSTINKDRSACDGANADSTTAKAVVQSVDTSW